jgi:hypothetical protein
MRFAFAAAIATLALIGCQKAPAEPAQPTLPPSPEVIAAPAPAIAEVEGWQTASSAHNLISQTIPDFALQKVGGGEVSRDQLRGRWTVLGFWNATLAGIEDETRYIRALDSAVDQDPDLDLLTIYLKLNAAQTNVAKWFSNNGGNPWPTLIDKGGTDALFHITASPAYLLIGPDLTVHAFRGALSADPDGIKSVIRGVAEIRRKVASPQ